MVKSVFSFIFAYILCLSDGIFIYLLLYFMVKSAFLFIVGSILLLSLYFYFFMALFYG